MKRMPLRAIKWYLKKYQINISDDYKNISKDYIQLTLLKPHVWIKLRITNVIGRMEWQVSKAIRVD